MQCHIRRDLASAAGPGGLCLTLQARHRNVPKHSLPPATECKMAGAGNLILAAGLTHTRLDFVGPRPWEAALGGHAGTLRPPEPGHGRALQGGQELGSQCVGHLVDGALGVVAGPWPCSWHGPPRGRHTSAGRGEGSGCCVTLELKALTVGCLAFGTIHPGRAAGIGGGGGCLYAQRLLLGHVSVFVVLGNIKTHVCDQRASNACFMCIEHRATGVAGLAWEVAQPVSWGEHVCRQEGETMQQKCHRQEYE